jgi:hypothetical protein
MRIKGKPYVENSILYIPKTLQRSCRNHGSEEKIFAASAKGEIIQT